MRKAAEDKAQKKAAEEKQIEEASKAPEAEEKQREEEARQAQEEEIAKKKAEKEQREEASRKAHEDAAAIERAMTTATILTLQLKEQLAIISSTDPDIDFRLEFATHIMQSFGVEVEEPDAQGDPGKQDNRDNKGTFKD